MATIKQKRALDNIVENGGNVSKAMKDAGYSPMTAKTPQKLTTSKGWQGLMKKYLPDTLLAKVHKEGLGASKIISANITYGEADEKTNDFIEVPDHATRHKFLESAYKLKSRFPKEAQEGNKTLVLVISGETADRYGLQSLKAN